MAKNILVTSIKGGTGVTTVCIGLGQALAAAGERTLIADGDSLSGGAMITAGLGNMQVYTLADYERAACRAKQTLLSHPRIPNLYFMPSLGMKSRETAINALSEIGGLFDYILLDKLAPETAEGALIVSEPYLPSVKSADVCRAALKDEGFEKAGLVVNKSCGGQIISGEVLSPQSIAEALNLPLAAVIPEDFTIAAGKWRKPTLEAFRLAALGITGRGGGVYDCIKSYTGLNGAIRRKMRASI